MAVKYNLTHLPIPPGGCYSKSMSEYLWILFGVLAVAAFVGISWSIFFQPQGQIHVRVDFDHYKGREGR